MTDTNAGSEDFPTPSDADLKASLTPEQYEVTQCSATEQPFTGEYWDTHDPGMYRCVVCDVPLFDSETKFDSGSGWPSFYQPASDDAIDERVDRSLNAVRTEIRCKNCGAHLGHVFPDGWDQPTGLRYCTNSAALRLDPRQPGQQG